jgi:hypothetical protein
MWIVPGSVFALVIALMLVQALKQPSNKAGPPSNHSEQIPALLSATAPAIAKEVSRAVFDNHTSTQLFDNHTTSGPTSHNSSYLPSSSPWPRLEDDNRLRVFDEL